MSVNRKVTVPVGSSAADLRGVIGRLWAQPGGYDTRKMAELPTGTITFLFTDIEGSTKLLQLLGERYREVVEAHGRILRRAILSAGGGEVRTEGDSFFAVFPTPAAAIRAAVQAQLDLTEQAWPESHPVRVRMGLHTGEGVLQGQDYIGLDVHRAARIAAAGHGGQVLISDATRGVVERDLPEGVRLRDLGDHRLKDLDHPERLFQLVIPGLPADFPVPKSLDARPNNLPPRLSSFVGREKEIAQTANLLAEHRLVTLTGPGGTGKTRLALEVADKALPRFEDGAFFIDLAPLTDTSSVPSAVATALGVKEESGRDLTDTLTDQLADRDLLLIPDNFEHLLDAAPLVGHLLGEAPRLRVLATSRTPLGLYGEQAQPVPPLGLPDPGNLPEPQALRGYEAVALFIDRARAVRPDFAVTNDNAAMVSEICTRLDGLPLAIELAASRINVLSPQAILTRLGQSLDLLTATARNMPERQRTLRGAIEWSYGLLNDTERRLFARMSVFAGGADLEALEAVANPGSDLGMDTLDTVASLVDKNLVQQRETSDGEPRFGMLETIKEYALDRLEADMDGASTRRRHAGYFLTLAEESEPHLTGEDQAEWLDRLDREHDNVLAALRWANETGASERGMSAAAAIWRFWHQRGHLAVGRTLLEGLLEAAEVGRSAARAKAQGAAGSLAYWQTDYVGTERHYRESLAIFREIGDRPGLAEALYNLAFVPIARGTDLDGAITLLQEADALYEELGDESGASRAKADIAYVYLMQGRYDSALPLLEEASARSRRLGDMFRLFDDLGAVGQAHRLLGNIGEARAVFLEALDIVERAGVPGGIGTVLEMMSALESGLGRHDRATRLFGAGEAIRESIGGGYPTEAVMLGDPVGAARQAIGDEAADRALAEGRAMSRDEAVAYAREVPS
jgi:predicted ATPase/class 3 adenylate cyclase